MNQTELLDQVRRYSEALMDNLPEPRRHQQGELLPARRPARLPGLWAGVSVAVLTIALIGVVPALLNGDEPLASSDSFSWSRLAHSADVFGDKVPFTGGMRDVTVGGPGLVAVGQGDDGIAVWTSIDGFTWSRVPHDEAALGGTNRMQSVTSGGPGLVAVGGRDDFELEDDGDAVVWTSIEGTTWSRVPHDEAVFGGKGRQEMVSVTASGSLLVAVGSDTSGGELDAAVWTSLDGLAWSRVPHDEAVFGGKGDQAMSSVIVGGPGWVAVGSDGFDDGVDRGQLGDWRRDFLGDAAVWTSVDGMTWSRVGYDETVFGGEGNQWMDDVTSTGSGLVAVGGDWSSEAFAAAVWMSVDGIAWSRIPYDEAVFGGEHDQAMNGVTATGSGVVAVGRAWAQSGGDHSDGSDDSAASVWTSADGVTWSWLGYDEAVFGSEDNSSYLLTDGPVFTEYRQFMSSVTATASGVVAVGADWSGPSHGAAVWVAVPGK